ncbi:MAG: amino acid permease [Pseudomonadota bacterium]
MPRHGGRPRIRAERGWGSYEDQRHPDLAWCEGGSHPPEQLLQKQLDRQLGLASVFSIAVGAMLGSGIFVLPGLAAALAGPGVGLSYLLAGLLVLPALLSKAELATAMPVSGGSYVYVDRSMGPLLGTITGLGTWFSLAAKTAFALAGLGAYLSIFSTLDPGRFALGALGLMLVLNIMGAGKVSGLQIGVVALCLAALAVFVAGGAASVDLSLLTPPFPRGSVGVIEGAAFVFVSYAGVTKVCSVAEEVRHPGRNLPRGMIAAQLTVMLLYGLVASVIMGNVPFTTLGEDVTPVATAAGVFLGPVGRLVFAVVAVVGLVSMCNAGVLSSTRYPFAMGRDLLMPAALQRVNPRLGTPVRAILLTGALLVLLVTSLPVVKLAKLASAFTIFLFCVDNLALVLLRETATAWYKPTFKAPLYPWLQIVGVMGGAWLLLQLGWLALWSVGGAAIVGSVWYLIYPRSRVQRRGVLGHLWGEDLAVQTAANEARDEAQRGLGRVIVPLLRAEDDANTLMRLGAAFVEEEGVLEVVRLEEVPDQTMLMHLDTQDDRMRQLERESDALAEDLHVAVDFRDVITHNARLAVAHHARVTSAEWIVMSWPGPSAFRRLLPNPLSWWLDHPPCDLAVFKPRGRGAPHTTRDQACYQRILVLAVPGPYDSLVVHVADRLAAQCAGGITLFMPAPVEEPEPVMQAHREYHRQLIRLCRSPAEGLILRTQDPESTIAQLSTEYDLLILGAPPESPLRNLLLGSTDLAIIERARCAVLRLKTPRHKVHTGLKSLLRSPRLDEDMAPFLRGAALGPRLRVASKRELFGVVARLLAAVVDTDLEHDIEEALWGREGQQRTALGQGVALSGVTLLSVQVPTIGVFTTAEPLAFGGALRPEVDVMFVVLASPADRQTQLWLKETFARLLADGWLPTELRGARSVGAMAESLRRALKRRRVLDGPPLPEPIALDEDAPLTEEIPADRG